MTHLEILAGKLDEMGEHAVHMAAHSRSLQRPLRSEYYHGQVVAFGQAADMLRQEALERERADKPAPTVEKLRDAREQVRRARSSEEEAG